MKKIREAPGAALFLSVFISSLLRVSEGAMAGLQCYIGNCTSMEDCRRPELVTDCPHDQAYDACLSIIVQKAYGRLTVEKRCGFRGVCPKSSVSWWSDECDRKSDEDSYTCTTCCTQTMCNKATSHAPYTCLFSLALIYYLSKILNKPFTS